MAETEHSLPHILVILGSTRQGRVGETVTRWLMPLVEARTDITSELADLRDWQLPYYDRPLAAAQSDMSSYEEEVRPWAQVIERADGFLVVTPEYNYGYPAVLKSALDAVYPEWNRKPIGFVSYGGWSGGTRAVQQLRLVAIELQMVPIRNAVPFQFVTRHFDENGTLKEPKVYEGALTRLLNELSWYAATLKRARTTS